MNRYKYITFFIFFLTVTISRSQNYEAKVDSLMALMTLQEKIGQTIMYGGS